MTLRLTTLQVPDHSRDILLSADLQIISSPESLSLPSRFLLLTEDVKIVRIGSKAI